MFNLNILTKEHLSIGGWKLVGVCLAMLFVNALIWVQIKGVAHIRTVVLVLCSEDICI